MCRPGELGTAKPVRERGEVWRVMIRVTKWPVYLVALLLFTEACAYIVLPEGLELDARADAAGWVAIPTNIVQTETGGVRVDLTLRNETGDWKRDEGRRGFACNAADRR